MKTPPLGAASTAVWVTFVAWCDKHAVPDDPDDWQYLWDCYFNGFAEGMKIGIAEASL